MQLPSVSTGSNSGKAGSGLLSLADAENWGEIITCCTGDAGDVSPEVVLGLLREAYRLKRPIGLDTEFQIDDIKRSPVHRAAIHLWSLGIPTSARRAGGLVAQRVVLGAEAIGCMEAWLRSDHAKLLYLAPADLHPMANAGVELGGWQDLFPFSRYLRPDFKHHGLKWHITNTLGYVGQGEYKDSFYRARIGVKGNPTKQREPIPLAELVPGHPLWAKMKAYAALDAKATVELAYVWAERHGFTW